MEVIITKKEKRVSILILVVSIITLYLLDLYMIFSSNNELLISPLYITNILLLCMLVIYSYVRRKRLKSFELVLLRNKDRLLFVILNLLLAMLLSSLLYQEISCRIDFDFLYASCLFTIGYLFNKPIFLSEDKIVINNNILTLVEVQDCYDKNGKLIVLIHNEEIKFMHLTNEEKNQVIEVFKKYQHLD